MPDLSMKMFFPNGYIWCDKDLDFVDGTYEVWERDVILNIFQIVNKRIIYYYKYNTEIKKRLITWIFEYIKGSNGDQICNLYRHLPCIGEKELYVSSHWDLYPNEYKKILEFKKIADRDWDAFVEYQFKMATASK